MSQSIKTVTMEIVKNMHGEFNVWTDDEPDQDFDTLAGAYLYASKRLIELSDEFFRKGLAELQNRINKL